MKMNTRESFVKNIKSNKFVVKPLDNTIGARSKVGEYDDISPISPWPQKKGLNASKLNQSDRSLLQSPTKSMVYNQSATVKLTPLEAFARANRHQNHPALSKNEIP